MYSFPCYGDFLQNLIILIATATKKRVLRGLKNNIQRLFDVL